MFKSVSIRVALAALSLTGTAMAQSPGEPVTPETIIPATSGAPQPQATVKYNDEIRRLVDAARRKGEAEAVAGPSRCQGFMSGSVGAMSAAPVGAMLGESFAAARVSRPTDFALAIDKLVREVHEIEEKYRRGEITADQRDLEQGKAVAGAVGRFGGEAVGKALGAAAGEVVAGPPGAVIGSHYGGEAGGAAGEGMMRGVAGWFGGATSAVVRTVRDGYYGTGEAVYQVATYYNPFAAAGR
jgi:hypothetical protein